MLLSISAGLFSARGSAARYVLISKVGNVRGKLPASVGRIESELFYEAMLIIRRMVYQQGSGAGVGNSRNGIEEIAPKVRIRGRLIEALN